MSKESIFYGEPWPEKRRTIYLCPAEDCGSDKIMPMDWEDHEDGGMEAQLRCGECESFYQGVFSRDQVDEFEDKHEADTRVMNWSLGELRRDIREDTIDGFSAALQGDHILPEDF